MKQKEFDLEEKYKLFRSVKELLHPTISKRNISNYKIIVEEDLLLLRVFYPKKVSNIKNVIIYIPGEGKITDCEGEYSEICGNLSKELDELVISIDYEGIPQDEIPKKVYETLKYIYTKLIDENIKAENISMMGDSTGANILINLIQSMNKDKLEIGKMALFYPALSGEYAGKTKYQSILENTSVNYDLIEKLNQYYKNSPKSIFPLTWKKKAKYPSTILLSGNVDPLIDEAKDFANQNENIKLEIIDFAYHGFLNTKDKEIIKEYQSALKRFMGKDE